MPAAARACALDAPPPFHSLQDSSRAVRWALAHVARAGDFLHLLHCVPHAGTLHGVEPGLYSPPGAEADEDGEAAAAAAMVERRFGGMLAAAGVPYDLHAVVAAANASGRAAAVAAAAASLGAALVILAEHPKARLTAWAHGSVTREVARAARTPTLVLKGEF